MKQSTCYCYTCRHHEFSHLLHQKWFQFHTLPLFLEWQEDGAGTVHWVRGGICGNTGGTSARCSEEREPSHKSLDRLHSVPHLRPLALGSDREDEVVNSSDWNEGLSECGWTQTSRQGGGVQTWGNLRQWSCFSLVWKTLLWEGGLEDPVTPATIKTDRQTDGANPSTSIPALIHRRDGLMGGWVLTQIKERQTDVLKANSTLASVCLVTMKSATVFGACVLQWLSILENDLHECGTNASFPHLPKCCSRQSHPLLPLKARWECNLMASYKRKNGGKTHIWHIMHRAHRVQGLVFEAVLLPLYHLTQ